MSTSINKANIKKEKLYGGKAGPGHKYLFM